MMIRKQYFTPIIVSIFFIILSGCASYERQVAPFKLPENTQNAVSFQGATIAARSFNTAKEAREVFGFDIRGAGILPVQVVFDNTSHHSLVIIPNQTFLIDKDSNAWPILDQNLAYDRISKSTEWGRIFPEATKSGLLLGAAGAVIGAAIGIVTGTNVGEALGKGAVIGGAAGIVSGGAYGFEAHYADVQSRIKHDLQSRSLHYRAIKPGELAYGFIFYPGEAKSAKVLRLQLMSKETGELSTFNMKLKE